MLNSISKLKPISIFFNHLVYYPTPATLSYLWSFGFLSGMFLVIQIISGLFLTAHYTNSTELAFLSVEHIMRDVNYGWLIRYIHSNGASFFFIVMYIHILRGVYYRLFLQPRISIWLTGSLILLLTITTAFLGYTLPWGQMSFWAATVITNLFTAIPVIGQQIAYWLWGGFAVSNATLNRFFMLHYLLPFVISLLAVLHIYFIHISGSSSPTIVNQDESNDFLPFYPYFILKDLVAFMVVLIFFMYVVFFDPNLLSHPDNYIMANSLSTPAHIVPEWYFLIFYAILRSIPNKLGGIGVMALAILSIFLLSFSFKILQNLNYNKVTILPIFFWIFVSVCVLLSWLGQNVVEYPFISHSLWLTCLFFVFLFIWVALAYYPFLNFVVQKK